MSSRGAGVGLHAVATRIASAIERGRTEGWLPGDAKPLLAGLVPCSTSADAATGGSLELLRDRLELSSTEILTLWTLVAFDTDPRLGRLLAHLADGPTVTVGVLLAVVYPDATATGVAELAEHGPLRRLGLLLSDPADAHAPISSRRVRVADRVLELALGTVALDHALTDLARVDDTSPGALTELVVPPGAAERLRAAMLERGTSLIVLQGRCGAGRRSLMAAAVAAQGKRALAIDARSISPRRDEARTQLRTVERECRLLELVPLLRDLDALSASGDAQDRLDLVESELSGCVLATTTRRIARRWNQPPTWIELPDLGGAQRAELWQRAIPVASGDAAVLANMYPLAPALMTAVGKHAMRACDGAEMRPHHIEGAIRTVLDDRLAGLATRITITQTWDDLVLPEDQTTAIIELLARIRERQRVYEEWGFAEKVGKGLGIAALFSGPPGTGKTMAAGLICRALHVEMFQVDLSKITSKWIGETEKNLAALFDAAEAGHAVLLFDEADSLFGKRSVVRSSNDRHANQEVNYLLQRMESFAGICLLTTNHEAAIDEAFRRRLTVQVRFPAPDATERKRLWGALLPSKAPVAEHLGLEALAAKYTMSGGHIKNAVVRAAFLAADESGEITSAHLLRPRSSSTRRWASSAEMIAHLRGRRRGLSVRLSALALVCILATACGGRPRWLEIDDARALYDGTRGDTFGSLLVDGNEVASCTRPWLLPEVVCEVDRPVIMTNTLDLELALDIGTVSRTVDLRTLYAGRNLIVLPGEGPLLIATVTFEVRFDSYVPWSSAVAIAILLGLGAAFALYLFLRARLLSGDGAKPRGIAITCARIATALALVGGLPLSHYAKTIEPVIVAIPTLLGTFAAAAIVIDAIGKRHLGGYRVGLLLNAVFAAALLPLLIGFAAMSLKAKAIVVGVMLLLLLGH